MPTLFHEDGVFEDIPLDFVARGHAVMKDFWLGTWASMPDFIMKIVSVVADTRRGGAEWVMSAT